MLVTAQPTVDRPNAPAASRGSEGWLIVGALVVIAFFAFQTTIANLPANKIFVGHDTGFYSLHPDQLIRTSAGAWEVKYAFGLPNFQALLTLPYALLVELVNAFGLSEPAVGRVFYLIELLICGYGSFALAWLVVRRAYRAAPPLLVSAAALGAAIFATYNVLNGVLLLYPTSPFQVELLMWPGVFAGALALLWYRPSFPAGMLFGVLLALATVGNPAHTMLGLALLGAVFVVDGLTTGVWKLRAGAGTVAMIAGGMAYMWLPSVAALLLYKGPVATTEGADPTALAISQALIASRTSFANLLHFDGLIWWPRTRNAELYGSATMMLLTSVPVVIALYTVRGFASVARWLWLAALIGLFLAKSVHQPFPVDLLWLQTKLPLLAAFRQTYDKFVMIVLIMLPPLFALGTMSLLTARGRLSRWAAVAGLACVGVAAWPFLAGRIAEPYFLTNVPPDYAQVDRLLGADGRAISLPGGPGQIYVASWFKGSNFENFLFRGHVVNGAVFKERAISASTLYDDVEGVQADELPRLVGMLGLYGIDHILLHKDYLTSYRMAFDYERYKVLGPLTALEMERLLDRDSRLTKVFEGSDLVLYRVDPRATMGVAYATNNAILAPAYEDTLLPFSDAGLTDAAAQPLLLFLGNQSMPTDPSAEARVNEVLRMAPRLALAPVTPERSSLYREEIQLPADRFVQLAPKYLGSRPLAALVFAQPHGDWLSGPRPAHQNLDGRFHLDRSATFDPSMIINPQRVATEVQATWFGTESGVAWPISSYGEEAIADDVLAEGTPVPRATSHFAPVTRVSLGRTSVSYQIELHRGADITELAVAGAPLPRSIPLLSDPHLTLSYEPGDPKVVVAWLRVVLRRADGHTIYFDKELDASGLLDDWALRDAAQAALDARFDEVLQLHQTDPAWVASQSFFNPEQAESYSLQALRIVYGKRPYVDMRSNPATYSFLLRSLRISLDGAPSRSFLDRGPLLSFGSPGAIARTNLPTATVSSKSGTLLVNSVVRESSEGLTRPIVGRSVTFQLNSGRTLIGDVLADTSDGYLVEIDAQHRQLVAKSDVAAIVATAPAAHREYAVTLPLPRLDVMRYPTVHIRYWLGSERIRTSAAFDVDTPAGRRHIEVSRAGQGDELPDQWVKETDYPGLDAPLTLDGNPLYFAAHSGWREAVFDLREIAAKRTGFVQVHPVDLTVTMSMDAGPSDSVSAYAFGFGDVSFTGQSSTMLQPPRDAEIVVDGRRLQPASVFAPNHAGNLVELRFQPLVLEPGDHTLVTDVRTPWSVVSSSLVAPRPAPSQQPHVTVRRVDDELYSLHLDAPSDAWIALAQTYHSGWRLLPATAPRNRLAWVFSLQWLRTPVQDHVVGNAFDNAWHVDGVGSRDYVIDFAPEDWLRIGEIVSLAWLLFALVFIPYAWRRA